MLELARDGAEEGLWLRAECQTAGRGRMGRTWVSEPGNLYASTLVRFRPTDPSPPTLAFAAGLAALVAIRPYADATLKWPNDLMLDGAKLAGILLERADDAVVIGFGINLDNVPVIERAVTGLKAVDPTELCEGLAMSFAERLVQWRSDLSALLTAWQASAHPIETPLSANLPDGERIEGAYQGLGPDGALLLRLADGTLRVIHAGDVFLI